MTSPRKLAIAAGICYLTTHVTSVAALILYGPILNNVNYIIGSGPDTRVLLGAFCEVILAFAIIGSAVALFPVVKRQNEAVALGYVGLRTLEAGIIAIDVASLLAVVTLRQQLAGAASSDTASLVALGRGLVALHNWTFLIGPSFTSGTNTVLIAYLMYTSRLVPRFIPVLGLIGGPLVFASVTGVLFGVYGQYSTVPAVAAVPEFAWELTLAIYLIAKGFNPSASVMEAVIADARRGGSLALIV
ncbi:MAG TPA: DUF4386 domain-containing protein [bacterium]|nr:DUF4386 domain-containing protein [bacterium]